jgi:hypothetical protein
MRGAAQLLLVATMLLLSTAAAAYGPPLSSPFKGTWRGSVEKHDNWDDVRGGDPQPVIVRLSGGTRGVSGTLSYPQRGCTERLSGGEVFVDEGTSTTGTLTGLVITHLTITAGNCQGGGSLVMAITEMSGRNAADFEWRAPGKIRAGSARVACARLMHVPGPADPSFGEPGLPDLV